jgi:hypothetical protein
MAGAMGATVHMHYCMGKLVGASLIEQDEDMCGKCGMSTKDKKKSCCKDEHKTIKTADHQVAKAHFDFAHQQFQPAVLPAFICYIPRFCAAPCKKAAQAHSPPSSWRTQPIYLQVCNFRI